LTSTVIYAGQIIGITIAASIGGHLGLTASYLMSHARELTAVFKIGGYLGAGGVLLFCAKLLQESGYSTPGEIVSRGIPFQSRTKRPLGRRLTRRLPTVHQVLGGVIHAWRAFFALDTEQLEEFKAAFRVQPVNVSRLGKAIFAFIGAAVISFWLIYLCAN
jgi:hypothetical protein